MSDAFLYAALAGIIGAGVGGLIGVLFGKLSNNGTSMVLSFTGGLMLAIVFFDLVPESISLTSFSVVICGILVGVLVLLVINYLLERKLDVLNMLGKSEVKTFAINNFVSALGQQNNKKIEKQKLFKTGIIMFIAIALHNLPEGMAIGTMGSVSTNASFKLAVLICIHDIPEGIAIATPLVGGGMSKFKSFLLSMLAGAVTIVGGLIGVILGGFTTTITAFSLALAAGAMLYVTLLEIIPETIMLKNSKLNQFMIIIGLLFGFVIINIL